jgi:hypothetical protein
MSYVMRRGRRIEVETISNLPAPTNRRRRKRDFIITTRAQSDRLNTVNSSATIKIFLYLQFLSFKSSGKPVRLANVALAQKGIDRFAKWRALWKLENLGLIQVTSPANLRK